MNFEHWRDTKLGERPYLTIKTINY